MQAETIFLSVAPSDAGGQELWSVQTDGTHFARTPVEDPDCGRVDVHAITRLPDARIGFIEFCLRTPEAGSPSPDRIYVAAVDPATGDLERLMTEPLRFNGHQITWNPAISEGFASTLSDLAGSIVGLTREGTFYAAIPVADDGFEWELDDFFLDRGDEHRADYGRADWPAWSRDGRSIAFFASAPESEVGGFDRLDLPWGLYVMSADDRQPERVLDGIRHPRGLAWSRDGRLAFGGTVTDGGDGLWTFDPDSEQLTMISPTHVAWLDWSPDGSRIAVLVDPERPDYPPERQLLIFDAS